MPLSIPASNPGSSAPLSHAVSTTLPRQLLFLFCSSLTSLPLPILEIFSLDSFLFCLYPPEWLFNQHTWIWVTLLYVHLPSYSLKLQDCISKCCHIPAALGSCGMPEVWTSFISQAKEIPNSRHSYFCLIIPQNFPVNSSPRNYREIFLHHPPA